MELSKQTLEELEQFFESEKIGENRLIKIPFMNNTSVPSRVISAIIQYSRDKLTREITKEITDKIEKETCLKIVNGLIELINVQKVKL